MTDTDITQDGAFQGSRGATLVGIAALLCLVPLFVTPVLPLIDFYAHVARFFILGNMGSDPALLENYASAWRLLPNLGLDVLGTGVMAIVPPLLGAKILGGVIILAPFLGALSLGRALHGRVGLVNVALAGILSFSMILSWGFANFLLGLGIALWALGLWIRLAGRPGLQLATALVVGVVIFLVHGLVFGLWGLLLGAVEVMQLVQTRPVSIGTVLWRMVRLMLVAVPPAFLFFQSRTAAAEGGVTVAFSNLSGYVEKGRLWDRLVKEAFHRLDSVFRVSESVYPVADRAFGVLLWGAIGLGLVYGALRLDRRLWLAVALAFVLVGLTPPNLFAVGHVDERIPLVLLALLAAGFAPAAAGSLSRGLPLALAALFLLHMAMVTVGWAQLGKDYRGYLAAVDGLPPGGMAEAAYFGTTTDREVGRFCKPLLFLLLLQKGIPVPTFANATQQPLEIIGPLKAAIAAEALIPADSNRAAQLAALQAANFQTVAACDSEPANPADTPTMDITAQDGLWRLYHAKAAP